MFKKVAGKDQPESDWYLSPTIKQVVNLMFEEACKGNQGKWKWKGFFLLPTEKELLPYVVLRAYLLGVDADPEVFDM